MSTEIKSPKAEHEIRRPGIKTSEGVFTALIVALPIVLPIVYAVAETLRVSLPATSPYLLPLTVVGAAIAASGYSRSRGEIKASRNMASAGPSTVAAGGDVTVNTDKSGNVTPDATVTDGVTSEDWGPETMLPNEFQAPSENEPDDDGTPSE